MTRIITRNPAPRTRWPALLAVAAMACLALAVTSVAVADNETPTPGQAASAEDGRRAFAEVYRVLLSPRCMNCHPSGDAPLQTDKGRPHAMNISRLSVESGLKCNACHQEKNSEAIGIAGGPPGAPHWSLPPDKVPMVFQGRTPTQLCEQFKDPAQTGGRDLPALLHHVQHDALVKWGWNPGAKRSKPPIPYDQFVAAFQTWVASGGACP